MNKRGTLDVQEPHPAVDTARIWWAKNMTSEKQAIYLESFSSCAIERNRLAEICVETLRRWMNNEGVSDRYFLGLVWTIRDMESDRELVGYLINAIRAYTPKWVGLTDAEVLAYFKSGGKP